MNWPWEQARTAYAQAEEYLIAHGRAAIPQAVADLLRNSSGPEARETLQLYNQGERQAAPTLDGIRPDHRGRYEFACAYVPSGAEVLDIACGVGYGSFLLATRAPARGVTGVDLSAEALEYGRRHYQAPNLQFVEGDALAFPLPENHYDVIVSFETLEHLREPRPFLERLYSALKPGGRLLLSVPNEESAPFQVGHSRFHLRHYTRSALHELIAQSGFSREAEFHQASQFSAELQPGWAGLFCLMVCVKS